MNATGGELFAKVSAAGGAFILGKNGFDIEEVLVPSLMIGELKATNYRDLRAVIQEHSPPRSVTVISMAEAILRDCAKKAK